MIAKLSENVVTEAIKNSVSLGVLDLSESPIPLFSLLCFYYY